MAHYLPVIDIVVEELSDAVVAEVGTAAEAVESRFFGTEHIREIVARCIDGAVSRMMMREHMYLIASPREAEATEVEMTRVHFTAGECVAPAQPSSLRLGWIRSDISSHSSTTKAGSFRLCGRPV